MWTRMIEHLAWADAHASTSLAGMSPEAPQYAHAIRTYAHLAAAEHVWLSRLRGVEPRHAVWPELTLEQAATLASESAAQLAAFVRDLPPDGGSREITYRNSAGQEFRNRVEDVLAQIVLHGSHHRGQLAMLARDAGAQPAATDYIVFVRGVPAPPQR